MLCIYYSSFSNKCKHTKGNKVSLHVALEVVQNQ